MSSSHPLKLAAVGAALLLSVLALLAGPTWAHASGERQALAAAETQPGKDAPESYEGIRYEGIRDNAPIDDARDRRVLAALVFTVIGTIGLITIGSVVLLTQPGDRQVMVAVEPADPAEESMPG